MVHGKDRKVKEREREREKGNKERERKKDEPIYIYIKGRAEGHLLNYKIDRQHEYIYI